MRKTLLIISLLFIFNSCDNSESFDAIITNCTAMDLKIHFVSNTVLSDLSSNTEVLSIKPGTSKIYERIGANEGIGLARLTTLTEFDSIYLTNISNKVLKIYKEGTIGRNIYNIDKYWTMNEPSKYYYKYTYEIMDEDIE